MIKSLVIIPAKGDSVRLKKKNLRIISGKTLVEHSIIYAKSSKLTGKIIVSTEDPEISSIAQKYGVTVIGRDQSFMGEREVADVYIEIFKKFGTDDITHVVGVQPDHPDRNIPLDEMLNYAKENKYDDLFTVDESGTRNGSIRITKAEFVKSGMMSRRVGSMLDNCTNIHTENDLINAEKNINERLH